MCAAPAAVVSLYGAGCHTGIVIASGEGATYAVAVYAITVDLLETFAHFLIAARDVPAGEKGYPVDVGIHGGGYSGGATLGLNGTAQVETISKGDIIWVTVNYRLNIHGFLGSEKLKGNDPNGSVGNYGLQDQRFALEWVQRSIGAFGGDKGNVMIDGSSAGGGSPANHFVIARSWPLFTKTAGESGMFATWNTMPLESAEAHFSLAV